MAQDADNAQNRLQNIEAVLPILGALRTISLGNWQSALKRHSGLQVYTTGLLSLLPYILHELPPSPKRIWPARSRKDGASSARTGIVYALGTERGLCGRYNRVLVETVQRYLQTQFANQTYELSVVGSRLVRALNAQENPPAIAQEIPSSLTGMPVFDDAVSLASQWLEAYETGTIDFVDLIYNANTGTGQYEPRVTRLIPPDMEVVLAGLSDNSLESRTGQWMIVDSDPRILLVHIIKQWTSISLYQIMLEATATEHAARYQLMEAADKNAASLIEELTLSIQSLRRQAITREMQELAAGAGLLR